MKCIYAALLGSFVLITATSLFGQGTLATVTGEVTDPTGGAVPGTTVTVRNLDTNIDKTVTTDSAGYYVIGYLIPG
jgi:hypothetical protein